MEHLIVDGAESDGPKDQSGDLKNNFPLVDVNTVMSYIVNNLIQLRADDFSSIPNESWP
jgi:hypothetical protein